ncbi:MAG: tripartite tricarboxylate transporter substrate binding protein [Betaproteobacteria bacterium]|nr:tripartite tricarboxylate transporter substrate binding protein [Betaproteobacteria bacterium]
MPGTRCRWSSCTESASGDPRLKLQTPRRCLAAWVLLTVSAGAVSALAQSGPQSYPLRAIRIVVPIPPGGGPDIAARVVGQKLAEAIGQPVIIENRAGSNGNIAGDIVAKAPPDGYTLLLGMDSLVAINPHLYAKMPFDPLKDLVPVATLVSNMFVMSVNPAVPVRSFQEFIQYARTATPALNYASGGNGSQHQLTMEMLKQRAGIDLVHVPYKGGSPATTATVAGEVAAMFAGTSTAPQIKSGKLRALAVTGARRSALFPDLPAIAEFYPGFETTIWLGLFAPANTPEAALSRLRAEIATVLQMRDVKERLNAGGGLDPFPSSLEEFTALIRRDYAKYGKLVKDIGARVD